MNKYRNKWTQCKLGHNHQSKREAEYCNELYLLKKANKIKDYTSQRRFELWCKDQYVCSHIVDFFVRRIEYIIGVGDEGYCYIDEVHEVKSKPTQNALWQLKKRLFEINYPDIKYIVIE